MVRVAGLEAERTRPKRDYERGPPISIEPRSLVGELKRVHHSLASCTHSGLKHWASSATPSPSTLTHACSHSTSTTGCCWGVSAFTCITLRTSPAASVAVGDGVDDGAVGPCVAGMTVSVENDNRRGSRPTCSLACCSGIGSRCLRHK